MRRSPLRRRKPLRSRRWGIKAHPPRRLNSPQNDAAFRRWVCTLDCLLRGTAGAGRCAGEVQPSHVTCSRNEKGIGLKLSDRIRVVPHCAKHHAEWDQRRGFFVGWTRDQRFEVATEWVRVVVLLATPEDVEQGRVFEEIGLGRLVEESDGRVVWLPGPMIAEAA